MLFKDEYKKANDEIMLDDYAKESIVDSMKEAQNRPCTALVHHKKKSVKAYIAIAAVIVMVLSSVSIMAINIWGEDFKEYFDWMNKNYKEYEEEYEEEYKDTADLNSDNFLKFEQIAEFGKDINASAETDDFTVTVKRIIYDNASLYAEIDITAPKDINLSVLCAEDDSLAINPVLTGDNILGTSTSSLENKLEKIGTDNTDKNIWRLYTRFEYNVLPGYNGMQNASILFFGIQSYNEEILCVMLPNDITSNVYFRSSDNDYMVTVERTYIAENNENDVTDTVEAMVNNIVLTPLSISYTKDLEWNEEYKYDCNCKIVFKDGTYLYFGDQRLITDDGLSLVAYAFPMPINLENVEDVIIDGTSIDFN